LRINACVQSRTRHLVAAQGIKIPPHGLVVTLVRSDCARITQVEPDNEPSGQYKRSRGVPRQQAAHRRCTACRCCTCDRRSALGARITDVSVTSAYLASHILYGGHRATVGPNQNTYMLDAGGAIGLRRPLRKLYLCPRAACGIERSVSSRHIRTDRQTHMRG